MLANGFVASVLAAVVIVLAMAVLGEYTKTRGRLLLTAILLGGFFLTSLGPAALAQRRSGSVLPGSGLGAALAGVALLSVGVWATPNSDGFWKAAAIVVVLAAALSYTSIIAWLMPVRSAPRIAARLSVAAWLAASMVASLGIAWGIESSSYWWVVILLVLMWAAAGLAGLATSWLQARLGRGDSRALGRD